MAFDTLLRGAQIVDGLGTPARTGDVAIRDDRIAAVGDLQGAVADVVVDLSGLTIAPGFIDVHNHSDGHLLRGAAQTWKTTQGFATEILMSDGISYAPVDETTWREWFYYLRGLNGLRMDEYRGWESIDDCMRQIDGTVPQNSAALVPYANVRTLACGFGRAAPDDVQVQQIDYEIRAAMEQGALGLSSGLDYVAQCFTSTDELVAACRAIAPYDGVYVTHIRYKLGLLEAIREAFDIARRGGVRLHISHLKALESVPYEQVFELLDAEGRDVDYAFDVYPYQPGSTMLNYLLPYEVWEQGPLAAAAQLAQPKLRRRFRRILESFRLPMESLRIAWTPTADDDCRGMSLAEFIQRSEAPPEEALSRLLFETRFAPLLVFLEGDDRLVEPFLQHDRYMMGSDGIYFEHGLIHPRACGSATRLAGPLVRERELFSLESAVEKMTSKPADWFRLHDRGRISEGAFADLVVFDHQQLADRATYDHPHQLSSGVRRLYVNGQLVLTDGEAADATPGRHLQRA